MSPKGVIQWLVAPNFAIDDPKGEIVDVEKLRGVPTLVSFARCKPEDADFADRVASLNAAAETVKAMGAHHVTDYFGECPADPNALTPSHPDAMELTYSIINHYLDEPVINEIPEGHFLIDRSGYVRARFRHFGTDDGNVSSAEGADRADRERAGRLCLAASALSGEGVARNSSHGRDAAERGLEEPR